MYMYMKRSFALLEFLCYIRMREYPEDNESLQRRNRARQGDFPLISEERKSMRGPPEGSSRFQEVAQEGREQCPGERPCSKHPWRTREAAVRHTSQQGLEGDGAPSWALGLSRRTCPSSREEGQAPCTPSLPGQRQWLLDVPPKSTQTSSDDATFIPLPTLTTVPEPYA